MQTNRIAALLVSFTLAAPLFAQTLEQRVDRDLPELMETYRALHAAPELSRQETKSSHLVAARLRELGYEVTEHVGKYEDGGQANGVVAVMRNGKGPTLLIRSDMDALPIIEQTGAAFASTVKAKSPTGDEVGVMHACGHDVHMTSLMGAAKILAETKSSWKGTLLLVAQPSEEIGAGAEAMMRDSMYTRFPRPDYSFAIHDWAMAPAGKVVYVSGYAMAAIDAVDITVRGVGGHGAAPHQTRDPIVLASQIVVALQTIVSRDRSPVDPVVVTVGSIHGGTKRNIIPDEVKLTLTVRTFKPEVRERVIAAIERIARGTAIAAGIPEDRMPIVDVLAGERGNVTYNDPKFTERIVGALAKHLGAANVSPTDPATVSEDFGYFSDGGKIPSALLFVGAGDAALIAAGKQPGLHSSKFLPVAEPAIRTAIRTIVTTAGELLGKKD
jgi:amidohydrolase